MMNFGTNLRRLRTERRVSQSELAQATGVRQSMISAIENGEKRPSIDLAFKIAMFFDVTLDSLYHDTGEPVAA